MAPKETDEVKYLTPKERLEKLKKIKKQREQEIQEAEKLMHEAQDEIKDNQKWEEKVPIPQVATTDTSNLSQEGKIIVQTQRGISKKETETSSDEESIEKSNKQPRKETSDLEETVKYEHVPSGQMQPRSDFEKITTAYITELSQVPMQNLYTEMVEVYGTVKEKGYLSKREQERIASLNSAIEQKVQDADAGEYSMTKEAARAASVSQEISKNMDILYHGNKSEKKDPSNWYDKN